MRGRFVQWGRLSIAAAALLGVPPGPGLAQEPAAISAVASPAEEAGVDEILVTIERRTQDLQKVPSLGELQVGGHWVDIDPRLEPREDETVVLKKGASGFFGTNLASILVAQGVDSVVLCGATTSGCIRATAIDLLQYGWPTIVPRECVGDRAQAPHDANLFDIQAKYADVVSVEEALGYLESVPSALGTAV